MTNPSGGTGVPQILIVDDVEINQEILAQMIESMGYEPRCASSVKEAAQMVEQKLPQLIMLDIFMPGIGGFEFGEMLKKNVRTRDIPIIFISADGANDNKWKGFELGAVDFIKKPFDVTEVTIRVETHLKMYQMKQELENTNRYLHQVIDSQMKRIEEEQRNTLYALTQLTEEDSAGNHLDNVSYNSRILAQSLQFATFFEEPISENFIEIINVAARLHDIGKLRVQEGTDEYQMVDTEEALEKLDLHAVQGALILQRIYDLTSKNDFLAMAIDIARYHHTRWDGKGRPQGKAGKDIPLAARIVAVVEIYDLLNTQCSEQYTEEERLELIKSRAGSYYDPEIVNVFLKIRRQMRKS